MDSTVVRSPGFGKLGRNPNCFCAFQHFNKKFSFSSFLCFFVFMSKLVFNFSLESRERLSIRQCDQSKFSYWLRLRFFPFFSSLSLSLLFKIATKVTRNSKLLFDIVCTSLHRVEIYELIFSLQEFGVLTRSSFYALLVFCC